MDGVSGPKSALLLSPRPTAPPTQRGGPAVAGATTTLPSADALTRPLATPGTSAPHQSLIADPPSTTEFYAMTGELLGEAATTGRKPHIMVDSATYDRYLEGLLGTADPTSPAVGNAFVDAMVTALTRDEKATGQDLIAHETRLALTFTGDAADVVYGGRTRQIGNGQLNVVAAFDNGKKAGIDSFSAVSGWMNNGLLPNGAYKAFKPLDAVNQFPDETGKFGFKMVILPKDAMARGDFRIHSVFDKKLKMGGLTEGCIGLNGGDGQNRRFHALMMQYFKTHPSITLDVAIEHNANVKRQLGEAAHY